MTTDVDDNNGVDDDDGFEAEGKPAATEVVDFNNSRLCEGMMGLLRLVVVEVPLVPLPLMPLPLKMPSNPTDDRSFASSPMWFIEGAMGSWLVFLVGPKSIEFCGC